MFVVLIGTLVISVRNNYAAIEKQLLVALVVGATWSLSVGPALSGLAIPMSAAGVSGLFGADCDSLIEFLEQDVK